MQPGSFSAPVSIWNPEWSKAIKEFLSLSHHKRAAFSLAFTNWSLTGCLNDCVSVCVSECEWDFVPTVPLLFVRQLWAAFGWGCTAPSPASHNHWRLSLSSRWRHIQHVRHAAGTLQDVPWSEGKRNVVNPQTSSLHLRACRPHCCYFSLLILSHFMLLSCIIVVFISLSLYCCLYIVVLYHCLFSSALLLHLFLFPKVI